MRPCQSFLIGYAYALGIQYGRFRGLAFDENDNHDPENGQFAPKGEGGTGVSDNTEGLDEFVADLPPDVQAKVKRVSIDFSKDNILPRLNAETLSAIGKPDKPVVLTKNIIEKNDLHHSDVPKEKWERVIGVGLYAHDAIHAGHKTQPYYNFMSRFGKRSSVVLLEMAERKDRYEIVNFHILRDRSRRGKEKIGEKIA